MRVLLLLSLLSVMVPAAAAGGNAGRYQVVAIPEGGRTGDSGSLRPKVFILDTRDGNMWTWSANEMVRSPDGKQRFGTVLTYEGKLRAGTRAGEVIQQHVE